MKDQRLSQKVVLGIVFVAVVMLSSSLWADTILLHFTPSDFSKDADIIVTPGAEPTQAGTFNFEGTFVFGSGAWAAAGRPTIGFLHVAEENAILLDQFVDFNGNLHQDSAYFIGFTAPGSNVIVDGIDIGFHYAEGDPINPFWFQMKAGSHGLGGVTCDQFIDEVGNNGIGGECFAYADGEIHDLGLFTGVDNLEVQ